MAAFMASPVVKSLSRFSLAQPLSLREAEYVPHPCSPDAEHLLPGQTVCYLPEDPQARQGKAWPQLLNADEFVS